VRVAGFDGDEGFDRAINHTPIPKFISRPHVYELRNRKDHQQIVEFGI
jgi:hypothetical protein